MKNSEVIDLLRSFQKQFPGLRIGQIIVNAVEEGANGKIDDSTIFYITDEQLCAKLKSCMKKYKDGLTQA